VLKVENIKVYYDESIALRGITLEVHENEVVALVGANGAGKTTTMRAISGILRPKEGTIKFNDQRIDTIAAHKIVELGISLVPEGRRIFANMTVLENLFMGSHIKDARKKRKESLQWIFSLYPILKERIGQLGGTLSGGEQQMLAIARALMASPKFLMLDEPSLGLAPILVGEIFSIIEHINSSGTTILLVEQNVYHALTASTRAYVMADGCIVLSKSSSTLLKDEMVQKSYLGM
jgi:branched-chain amino acid transport system ATP-binding protein